MHVLILGARAPVCLEWARIFKTVGWRVTAADSVYLPLTRASRSVDSYLRLPEPRQDPARWTQRILEFVRTNEVALVLPTCEEIFYLAHGLDNLSDHCRIMSMDLSTLHLLHHKGLFAELSHELTMQTPETHVLYSDTDLARFNAQSTDWVFKPAYSRFASRTLICPQTKQLFRIRPDSKNPWIAQRYVEGNEYCSFSILVDGRLTAHACYSPRYRIGKGSGIYFSPTDPPPIRRFLEAFGKKTAFTGQVGFDFIESGKGNFQVLECNPRATSGLHLFAGQEQALVEALLGTRTCDVVCPGKQPRMLAMAMLIFSAPRRLLLSEFWRDFYSARDVIFRTGDGWPQLIQFLGLFEILMRAFKRRCGLLAAATSDIEWNGQVMDSQTYSEP